MTSFIGNITRDPELRYTQTAIPVVNFGLAVNYKKGEEEGVVFWNVTAWRDLAENVAESLSKGDRVFVEGRIESRKWEDKSGEARTAIEINAWEVGPSLRWASVEGIKKNPKESNNKAPNEQRIPAEAYDLDEEPF